MAEYAGGAWNTKSDLASRLPGDLRQAQKFFRGVVLRLNRGDDGFGDLVPDCENVGKVAVVAFSPDAATGRDIELCPDAHAINLHVPLDYIADTKHASHATIRAAQDRSRSRQS